MNVTLERIKKTGMLWTTISRKRSTKKRDLWFWSDTTCPLCARKATAQQTWWGTSRGSRRKTRTHWEFSVFPSSGNPSRRRHGTSRRSRGRRNQSRQDPELLHRLLSADIHPRSTNQVPPPGIAIFFGFFFCKTIRPTAHLFTYRISSRLRLLRSATRPSSPIEWWLWIIGGYIGSLSVALPLALFWFWESMAIWLDGGMSSSDFDVLKNHPGPLGYPRSRNQSGTL